MKKYRISNAIHFEINFRKGLPSIIFVYENDVFIASQSLLKIDNDHFFLKKRKDILNEEIVYYINRYLKLMSFS